MKQRLVKVKVWVPCYEEDKETGEKRSRLLVYTHLREIARKIKDGYDHTDDYKSERLGSSCRTSFVEVEIDDP